MYLHFLLKQGRSKRKKADIANRNSFTLCHRRCSQKSARRRWCLFSALAGERKPAYRQAGTRHGVNTLLKA
jgi:hypothetical protein